MSFEILDDKGLEPYDLPDSSDEEPWLEEESEEDRVRRLLAAYGF